MKGFRRRCILGVVLLLVFLAASDILWSLRENRKVKAAFYKTESDERLNIRLVLLADLHNGLFGEENQELISAVRDLQPDLICMAGDMLNSDEQETEILTNLVRQVSEIAPVFYSYGNHEEEYEENYGKNLDSLLTRAGACVLQQKYVDVDVKGHRLRIGGLYGYAMPTQPGFDGAEQRFLEDFQETDAYRILLCHMPAAWIQWNSLEFWDTDMVLSGHAHGGQVKIPLLGGVYAPDQGWFPDFTAGQKEVNGKYLIVSAGLGSEGKIPRMNNPPELVVVDF